MGSVADDRAFIHDQDVVAGHDRGYTLRDENQRGVSVVAPECVAEFTVRPVVEC